MREIEDIRRLHERTRPVVSGRAIDAPEVVVVVAPGRDDRACIVETRSTL